MRKMALLLLLLLCLLPLTAEELQEPPMAEHASETLRWQIEEVEVAGVRCFLTRIWMKEPGRQIGKATADWRENVLSTEQIAARAPEASLIINASGYVTRRYSWIPENYPGTSEDYYFTPLGSLTVTDGEVFRHLAGVPYYGLTLSRDGLHLHVGEDPADVLAQAPIHTWSFYVECPVIQDHRSILDPAWRFTNSRAMRNIICRMDANNYLLLTVTSQKGGLTMQQCVDYLLAAFSPEWAYNLDGGPSAALMYRDDRGEMVTVWASRQENVDIMTFSDLANAE